MLIYLLVGYLAACYIWGAALLLRMAAARRGPRQPPAATWAASGGPAALRLGDEGTPEPTPIMSRRAEAA